MNEYRLTREELLVYPGLNDHLGACHLRVYEARGERPVCIVGSFDELIGTSIQNAIEVVATTIRERIGASRFTLIEWWPHTGCPFVEVRLRRVRSARIPFGRVTVVSEGGTVELDRARRVRVRLADPEWRICDGERIAEWLGADALRELDELAGEPGEYDPVRVFGVSGRMRIDAVHRHNDERVKDMLAQLAEMGIR